MGKKVGGVLSDALWMQCKDKPLEFTIPGHPPSVNKLYNPIRGRLIKSREGHKWEGFSLLFVRRAAIEAYGTFRLDLLKGRPISLEIVFYRPSWRAASGSGLYVRPDVSNFIKAAEDGIMTALGLDDSAVVNLTVSKAEDKGAVRMFARIRFLEEYI